MLTAWPPNPLISSTRASSSGWRRAPSTTLAPSLANRMALARPMPELAPVMMATLLDSCDMADPSLDVYGAR
ncbi:hypothetical protein D3C85_1597650 [compost metagenome]